MIYKIRKKELDMLDITLIPLPIYILIISLIALILLSIYYKKLKPSTVVITEYIIKIAAVIVFFLMFIPAM